MVAPAIGAGLAAGKIIGGAKGLGGLLKAFYASKHFIPALMGAGYLGSVGIGAVGQAGERGLTREQLRLQTLLGKVSAEATEKTVKESRARTKEYMKTLMKSKREEAKEIRELAALQSFRESQDRQIALLIQAMQVMGQRQTGAITRGSGAGRLGLIRGGF